MSIRSKNILLFSFMIFAVLLLAAGLVAKREGSSQALSGHITGYYLSGSTDIKDFQTQKTVYKSNGKIDDFAVQDQSTLIAASQRISLVIAGKSSLQIAASCPGVISNAQQFVSGSFIYLENCQDGKQILSIVYPEETRSPIHIPVTAISNVIADARTGYVVIQNGDSGVASWLKFSNTNKQWQSKTPVTLQQYGNLGQFYYNSTNHLAFWGTSADVTSYSAYDFTTKAISSLTPPSLKGYQNIVTFTSFSLNPNELLWATTAMKKSDNSYSQVLFKDSVQGTEMFYDFTKAGYTLSDGTVIMNPDRTILYAQVIDKSKKKLSVFLDTHTGKVLKVSTITNFKFS